ncbi:hypothetical protein C7H83_06850 [Tetragenococcus halophilus]|uniref:Uncharacterized protein n=1 Tax=Tetragenococcus halophilus TaxID=51669 RepID=A0A3G5FIL8_TETHA|nr:hypothetical protein [Tetragenococcus halophilus]AYW50197.1 hypothetical protein C7H83_06850 [Tetragenococcus halophilus]MCO8288273.1 hypothetical protein [Tetragenococcus halophilus]MCO8290224.1 hypothetical protein [Tetragenococcus halophilus]MCO8294654.1 hypothetical protein [Tetragenococcus halophilus]GBD63791.1 hypothetical protein TEHD23766T_1218 [Tetragenococcus halophilus subsp. flandriensis]
MNFFIGSMVILGLLGIIVGLIWIIINAIRNSSTKTPGIVMAISTVSFAGGITIILNISDSEVNPGDLEITANDEYTYSDWLEFETDEDGIASIKAATAGNAEVTLTPENPDLDKQTMEADENGNFTFEVEMPESSLETYELQAFSGETKGKELQVDVWNDYYEDDTDVEEDESEEIELEEDSNTDYDNVDPADYDTGITYDDLARNPDDNKFENVTLSGTIIQVLEGSSSSQYRLAVDDNYDNIVLIDIPEKLLDSRVLEDDILTIYGESEGTVDYESTMGGNITVPFVSVDKFETNGQAE